MTTTKVRLTVGSWTTVRFRDRDVQAQVVNISNGWVLARVKDDPEIGRRGYIMIRESQT